MIAIAMPFCLAIPLASGHPSLVRILTASMGAVVAALLCNSELMIKGLAASVIIIAVGCIGFFGSNGMSGVTESGYFSATPVAIAATALAAVLTFVGWRLVYPSNTVCTWQNYFVRIVVFVATAIGVLATNLFIGFLIGFGAELVLNWFHGVPTSSILKPYLKITRETADTFVVSANRSAIFSNWVAFRQVIECIGLRQKHNLIIDLSSTDLADRGVMNRLYDLQRDFKRQGLKLQIRGFEDHGQLSQRELAALKRLLANS